MDQNVKNGFSYLLEIGTEDLPARFIPSALQQLNDNTRKILNDNYVRFSDISTCGTPRRLAVIIKGIPLMQEDRTREVFGPSKKAAFDEKGNPTKAAIGFAQGQGVGIESLTIRNKDKGEYVAAIIEEKGVQVRDILPEISKKIVLAIYLPKSMRWGSNSMKFVRPIRWLMALFDNQVVSFEIDGIKSGNLTRGHRFLSPAAFQLKETSGYKKLLANNFVVVDYEERRKIILVRMEALLSPLGNKPLEDQELIQTVANLVEYPVPVLAAFSEEYLRLPKELLVTVMKGHQKYFAVEDKDGKITNNFVVISNTSEENADTVRVGAERVIRARFEDAKFYFEEDRKRKLSERTEDLKKVTFQENLGSLYDKTERLVSLAGYLADKLMPTAKDATTRAAWLAKADLITGVVREFPELQGIMGKYYARLDGEEQMVAEALEEQYLPTHSGGRIPQTDTGAFLSIADKIDNITAFFSIGLIPTGSEDPFAHRRQALGIIAIILNKGYALPLRGLVNAALNTLPHVAAPDETGKKIVHFFENRLETVFADLGYPADMIQSVISLAADLELGEIRGRLEAVKKYKEADNFNDFLTAIKRVNNIIPKTAGTELNTDLLMEEPERRLKESLDAVRAKLTGLLLERRHDDVVQLLTSLTGPINAFFDGVLVMDKREEVKANRLSLLNEIWKTISGFADFSKLSARQDQ
jgi:glycyl-tRNA synthetase beta chain